MTLRIKLRTLSITKLYRYAGSHYAECRILNAAMLSVIMLSVVMLSVVAPQVEL